MANMLINKYAKAKTGLDFARNVFSFKKGHKTNFLTGRIVPSIDPIEVIPGDSFNLSFAAVVRSAPLVAPVLDDLYIDVCAFWVPNRLVLTEFAQFLGENNTTAWTLKQDVDLPSINQLKHPDFIKTSGTPPTYENVSEGYYADHYLARHMGIRSDLPSNQIANYKGTIVSDGICTLKPRGYCLIYNEWWRDENIIDPILFSKESGSNNALDTSLFYIGFGEQRKAARLSDFWNKMLPAPQRGNDVNIDLLGFAPVVTRDVNVPTSSWPSIDPVTATYVQKYGTKFYSLKQGDEVPDDLNVLSSTTHFLGVNAIQGTGPSVLNNFAEDTNSDNASFVSDDTLVPANLWADLSQVSALTVNQLRYAIMLQRFYEISARGGMREVEFYEAQFGVTSSDARFMRSELLTQKRFRINISQVLNQAGDSSGSDSAVNSALGSTGAYSVTGIKGHLFAKTFTEYGFIHIQHCVRTQPSIASGIDRSNFKIKFFDHFLPVFDHIGEQAYYTFELGDKTMNYKDVFGYNEAWAEYRHQYSDCVGLFMPGQPLEYWTLARKLTNPVLNQWFIEQGIEEFDRALIYPMMSNDPSAKLDSEYVPYESNTYQWLIDFYVTGNMARTMSKNSTPGILGRI